MTAKQELSDKLRYCAYSFGRHYAGANEMKLLQNISDLGEKHNRLIEVVREVIAKMPEETEVKE
jgi:hypothetical protein